MKRMQKFWGIALLLIAVVLTVTNSRQDNNLVQEIEKEQRNATIASPQETHHEATLTDVTSLYRVCNSRPQRLLPTQGSKTERTANPCGFVRCHIVKPLHSLFDSRCRMETAPFCRSVSCLYYVIALRRIIR